MGGHWKDHRDSVQFHEGAQEKKGIGWQEEGADQCLGLGCFSLLHLL